MIADDGIHSMPIEGEIETAPTDTAYGPPDMFCHRNNTAEQLLSTHTDASSQGAGGISDGFLGESPPMRGVFRDIHRVARLDLTVMIEGASGTGKELAARALHQWSGRRGAFIAINCGAVAADVLPSVLFGHERGSFTGAVREHRGLFEQAHNGTLFFDEITEMPYPLQAHLLRAIEAGVVRRVGGNREVPIGCRVVAATNRDSLRAVDEGLFREDLYYRLTDFLIRLPLLCERPADVFPLAQHFLHQFNTRYGTQHHLSPASEAALCKYSWPGNVRELRQVVQRACLTCNTDADEITIALPVASRESRTDGAGVYFSVGMTFVEMEQRMLRETLARFGNDKPRAAKALGISLKTIYNRLARDPIGGKETLQSEA